MENMREGKLSKLKYSYITYIDKKAEYISQKLVNYQTEELPKQNIATKLILKYTQELYNSAKCESKFKCGYFEVAYHPPISSDLEFLLSRVLFHYSKTKNFGWKVYLRRQFGKTAPDIRLEVQDKTIGIIEVKAKAGWLQTVFSPARYEHDLKMKQAGKLHFDPDKKIKDIRGQMQKYYETFKINENQVYMILPSFALVHRKKSSLKKEDYVKFYSMNAELPKESLVVLSNNLNLDLSYGDIKERLSPTSDFERMISKLSG